MVTEKHWQALSAELARQRNEALDRLAESAATIGYLNSRVGELQAELGALKAAAATSSSDQQTEAA